MTNPFTDPPHALDLTGELLGIARQVYLLHLLAEGLRHTGDRNAVAQIAFQLEERLWRVEKLVADLRGHL